MSKPSKLAPSVHLVRVQVSIEPADRDRLAVVASKLSPHVPLSESAAARLALLAGLASFEKALTKRRRKPKS